MQNSRFCEICFKTVPEPSFIQRGIFADVEAIVAPLGKPHFSHIGEPITKHTGTLPITLPSTSTLFGILETFLVVLLHGGNQYFIYQSETDTF